MSEPLRKVTFTSSGKEIDLKEEMGMAISIPSGAPFKDEEIELAASFSGAYKTPEDVTSVSPAYIIETSSKMEFRKEIEVKIQHTANIKTEEDQQNLTVMKASSTHLEKDSVRKFEEMKETKLKCTSNYIIMKMKSIVSAIYKVVKKGEWVFKKDVRMLIFVYAEEKAEKLYSARLYKSITGIKVTAVLCVCQWQPIYTKVRIIHYIEQCTHV